MNKVEVFAIAIVLSLAACVVVWSIGTQRKNVASVERCEQSGGVAVIAAREGYACLRQVSLVP